MGASQHKEVLRRCPQCGEKKLYPVRNLTCSPECASANKLPVLTDKIEEKERSIFLRRTRIQSLEELVKAYKVDERVWKAVEFTANKWEMAAVIDKKITVEPLFQVKARFVRQNTGARAEIEDLKREALRTCARPAPRAIRRGKPTGKMLEINIPDLHAGKLAWGKETGYADYDVRIAERLYWQALDAILERSAWASFDEIVLVVGNDLLQADNAEGTTTAGTVVDCDGRYKKTFTTVRKMITDTIDKLVEIAPVKVVMVSGNHDSLSVWHLGDTLEVVYRNYSDVKVDNSPTSRKYHQFGSVMLMFTHGHKGKKQDKPLLMATEQPGMWGATKFREIHTGHVHAEGVLEKHGIKTRSLPSLCAEDEWHSENEFTGNIRSAIGMVWDRHEGLVGTAIYTVNE